MTNTDGGGFLDGDSARWWARGLAPAGPTVTRGQAERVTGHLRVAARRAPSIVAEITGLQRASELAGHFPRLVVDRPTWAEANVAMFVELIGEHLSAQTGFAAKQGAALELGGMLGLLSTRVLGQFDPFSGRLYLVAPNIVNTRRLLRVSEKDFAMWVALHEQTHAVQFAAAPWLPDYLRSELGNLLEGMSEDHLARVWRLLRNLPRSIKDRDGAPVGALAQAALTPRELQSMERVAAVMSMLEGHADVVMDQADDHIPSTTRIRKRFTRRREEPGFGESLLRRLIGMDAKLAQYRDGAVFVNAVVADVGHEGFNRVFEAPDNLPTPAEIAEPGLWIARMGQ